MIDTKSKLVLSILAKESADGSYKIIEISDIIMALPKRYRMDSDAIKHILTHLERQDIISVKYDDDDVFCLAVLPYGFEILENEKPVLPKKVKEKSQIGMFLTIFLCFVSSLVGSAVAIFFCWIFSLLK